MKKTEIYRIIGDRCGMTQSQIQSVMDVYADVVRDYLHGGKDDCVPLPNLGWFKIKEFKKRKGTINFGENAGQVWEKPAHTEVNFVLSKSIKEINHD